MKRKGPWVVTPDSAGGIRPAGPPDRCFYCGVQVGEEHAAQCVIRLRTVVVAMEIEYVVSVPEDWDADTIYFHRNEGSWCSNNGMAELDRVMRHRAKAYPPYEPDEDDDAWDIIDELDACEHVRYHYVREATVEDELRDGVYVETAS